MTERRIFIMAKQVASALVSMQNSAPIWSQLTLQCVHHVLKLSRR